MGRGQQTEVFQQSSILAKNDEAVNVVCVEKYSMIREQQKNTCEPGYYTMFLN